MSLDAPAREDVVIVEMFRFGNAMAGPTIGEGVTSLMGIRRFPEKHAYLRQAKVA